MENQVITPVLTEETNTSDPVTKEQVPQTGQSPSLPKKKPKKLFLIIALIIVLLIISTLSLYLFIKSRQSGSANSETFPSTQPTIIPENVNQTSFKIYLNRSFNVSFEYPDNWNVYDKGILYKDEDATVVWGSPGEKILFSPNDFPDSLPEGTEYVFSGFSLSAISPTKQYPDVNSWRKSYESTGSSKVDKIEISGHEAFKVESDSVLRGNEDGFPKYITYNIFVPENGFKNLQITLSYQKDDANLVQDFEKTIASITILKEQNCPTNSLYYENNIYSVCYPNDFSVTQYEEIPQAESGINSTKATLSNGGETMTITTRFTGGWGGGMCLNESKTIAGQKSTILGWDMQGSEKCQTNFINLVAVIGNERNGNFPIAIDYQKGSATFVSKEKFDALINSFKFRER